MLEAAKEVKDEPNRGRVKPETNNDKEGGVGSSWSIASESSAPQFSDKIGARWIPAQS